MSLVVDLLHLSTTSAQDGDLVLLDAEVEDAERRLGEPVFLRAHVPLAGLGVMTVIRTGEKE